MTEVESYESRADRPCMGCGQRDKAPRDQVALSDGNTALYHWDCHVLIADCAVCKAALAAFNTDAGPRGLKNEKLYEKVAKELNKSWVERAEIFTTDAAIPQD